MAKTRTKSWSSLHFISSHLFIFHLVAGVMVNQNSSQRMNKIKTDTAIQLLILSRFSLFFRPHLSQAIPRARSAPTIRPTNICFMVLVESLAGTKSPPREALRPYRGFPLQRKPRPMTGSLWLTISHHARQQAGGFRQLNCSYFLSIS